MKQIPNKMGRLDRHERNSHYEFYAPLTVRQPWIFRFDTLFLGCSFDLNIYYAYDGSSLYSFSTNSVVYEGGFFSIKTL